jgi:two-component system sensor histidine kinase AtoS
VEISDTGKGIHPNHLPRIFNPFYSTKPSGTGLGLSVAHEIMVRHGGTIRAESEEGKGATLILQIPKFFYPQGSEGTDQ